MPARTPSAPAFGASALTRRATVAEVRKADVSARARWVLLGSAGATFLLYLVPYGGYVLYPLMLLSTLAHEAGHGVAAALVGGTFERLVLNADGSGMAYHSGVASRLGVAFIAAGGLVGPAVVGALLFVLARWQVVARGTLVTLGALVGLLCLTVVGNVFGWLFTASVAAACLYVGLRRGPWSQHAVVFIAAQLALSVYLRGDYLFTRTAELASGRFPSDVELMSRAIPLPYWLWGAACGLFSLAVLGGGLVSYLGLTPQRFRPRRPGRIDAPAPEAPPLPAKDAAIEAELARLRDVVRR